MSPEAVGIGGSAGSLDALQRLLPKLPADYSLAVMVVVHQHRHGAGRVAEVLQRCCRMRVIAAIDKEPIEPGRVHVCPANYHLLVEADRTLALSTDPPVNHACPSIDVFFESASRVYRERLVGVLLSGASADGARGMAAVKAAGGKILCQDPATAAEPTMPRAACAAAAVDSIGSPETLGIDLARLRA
jgi:two-component system chemotaxis response regulator CheB